MKVAWLDQNPGTSVYQSRGYGEASSSTIGGTWDVLGDAEGRWRIPLCISDVGSTGYRDATSPYGYAGIAADAELNPAEIGLAWEETLKSLASRDIVSVFLRFAPYREDVRRFRALPGLEIVELSQTVVVDLADESKMWAAMAGRSRTAVRKADKVGLRSRVIETNPLNLRAGEGFRHVYDTAMERVKASPAHRHQDEYYRKLTSADDIDVRLIEVLDNEESVVAATLLLVDDEAVHYHLSGSLMHAAKSGANNLLIWTAMRWAAEQGHARLHLGGGTSRDDSLYKFKASFGGRSLPFFAGRLIVMPEAYEHLVAQQAKNVGMDPQALRSLNFFPAYRAVSAP